MQLQFKLPEIDREATRASVESEMERYKMFLLMDPEDNEPSVTSAFKLVPSAPSNQFHSTTEDAAINKVDQEIKRKKFITRIQKAVNRLGYQERAVIIHRYLQEDDVFDYEVYNELGFSERKYYRIKSRAFYKLAFILRLETYKKFCRQCGDEVHAAEHDSDKYECFSCSKIVDTEEVVQGGEVS